MTYHLLSRDFELPELKLLVDAVQSSRFISEKKSRELINKLEKLVSRHDADKLQRQVLISGRVKSMNESTYYAVDCIHNAISMNRQISFQYTTWNVNKQEELRRNGKWYVISPWHLCWDDENYYLIGYDEEIGKTRHFRVDKMKSLKILDTDRAGREQYKKFNPSVYTKKLFGMFSGQEVNVTLEGDNSMVGVIIDRFGKDIPLRMIDDSHFRAHVDVAESPQFYGWLMSLAPGIKVTHPESVVKEMKNRIDSLNDIYR
ncbi:MAG: WYL domain-containing protein [Parasporobacterium sp.]|nr:WYL domain-containing protein [Parasporobacterium sp.]